MYETAGRIVCTGSQNKGCGRAARSRAAGGSAEVNGGREPRSEVPQGTSEQVHALPRLAILCRARREERGVLIAQERRATRHGIKWQAARRVAPSFSPCGPDTVPSPSEVGAGGDARPAAAVGRGHSARSRTHASRHRVAGRVARSSFGMTKPRRSRLAWRKTGGNGRAWTCSEVP